MERQKDVTTRIEDQNINLAELGVEFPNEAFLIFAVKYVGGNSDCFLLLCFLYNNRCQVVLQYHEFGKGRNFESFARRSPDTHDGWGLKPMYL